MINKQIIFILIACFFGSNLVLAEQESSFNKLCETVLKTKASEIITEATISQTELTIPSLWWRQQQLDPDREIIINWQAYPEDKIIDLIVDRQRWNLLDYIQRYSIVNNFGSLAREYQYNLRVISDRQVCLVAYNCDFDFNPDRCEIDFNFLGRGSLERRN